jgi:hypothetical protein
MEYNVELTHQLITKFITSLNIFCSDTFDIYSLSYFEIHSNTSHPAMQ